MNLKKTFEKYNDEYLKFENCTEQPCFRPDLCAFIILDRLVPDIKDIIGSAEHDEFYLSVEPINLAAVATEEDIANLVRCGVRYDNQCDSLCMFA